MAILRIYDERDIRLIAEPEFCVCSPHGASPRVIYRDLLNRSDHFDVLTSDNNRSYPDNPVFTGSSLYRGDIWVRKVDGAWNVVIEWDSVNKSEKVERNSRLCELSDDVRHILYLLL